MPQVRESCIWSTALIAASQVFRQHGVTSCRPPPGSPLQYGQSSCSGCVSSMAGGRVGIPGPGAYHAAESASVQAPSAPAYPFGLRPHLSQKTFGHNTPVRPQARQAPNQTRVFLGNKHNIMMQYR